MTGAGDEVPGYRLGGMLSERPGRRLHRAEALGSPGRPLMIEVHDIEVEEDTLARLRRRTDEVRALGHPGLLPVHALVPLPNGIALVMPAAVGGALADVIDAPEDAGLKASAIAAIASAARAAVAAAHANGLHHGALSADQVRFDAGGAPLLLGFGTGALRGAEASGQELRQKDHADLERLLEACSRDVSGGTGTAPTAGDAPDGDRHDAHSGNDGHGGRDQLSRRAPTPGRAVGRPAPATEAGPVRRRLVLAAAAVLATPLLLVLLAVSGG